jgi:type IX secretion system substrate protein
MKKILPSIFMLLLFSVIGWGQCSGLRVIGMQGDNPDILTIEATTDIPGSAVFYITDNEWNSTNNAFDDLNEDEHSWTAPVEGIAAGSIIQITGTSATCGTVTGTPLFSAGGEEVYILSVAPSTIMGSVTSSNICFALSTGGGGDLPVGTSVNVGNFDNTAYNGTGDITISTNWTSSNGAVSQPTEGCDLLPLPIHLSSFTAKPMDTKTVSLDWSTANEENNEYFSIEHSTNGRDFIAIDQVEGALNSSETQYYNYQHKDAARGMNYYRLRQVDTDGVFSFSPIAAVTISSDVAVEVRPTLAKTSVLVLINEGLEKEATIEVYNVLGRLVISQVLERGATQTDVDINKLQKGHYFIKVVNGPKTQVSRFIKQ